MTDKRKMVSLRLTEESQSDLKFVCERYGLTQTQAIEVALRAYKHAGNVRPVEEVSRDVDIALHHVQASIERLKAVLSELPGPV